MLLNCGRENFGGFNVKQINSKNGDAVIYNSIMGENLCVSLALLLAGIFLGVLIFFFTVFFFSVFLFIICGEVFRFVFFSVFAFWFYLCRDIGFG